LLLRCRICAQPRIGVIGVRSFVRERGQELVLELARQQRFLARSLDFQVLFLDLLEHLVEGVGEHAHLVVADLARAQRVVARLRHALRGAGKLRDRLHQHVLDAQREQVHQPDRRQRHQRGQQQAAPKVLLHLAQVVGDLDAAEHLPAVLDRRYLPHPALGEGHRQRRRARIAVAAIAGELRAVDVVEHGRRDRRPRAEGLERLRRAVAVGEGQRRAAVHRHQHGLRLQAGERLPAQVGVFDQRQQQAHAEDRDAAGQRDQPADLVAEGARGGRTICRSRRRPRVRTRELEHLGADQQPRLADRAGVGLEDDAAVAAHQAEHAALPGEILGVADGEHRRPGQVVEHLRSTRPALRWKNTRWLARSRARASASCVDRRARRANRAPRSQRTSIGALDAAGRRGDGAHAGGGLLRADHRQQVGRARSGSCPRPLGVAQEVHQVGGLDLDLARRRVRRGCLRQRAALASRQRTAARPRQRGSGSRKRARYRPNS
jgi:hypothetical protein